MISTLCFIQFIAFYLWQITVSKRQPVNGLLAFTVNFKSQTRVAGVTLGMIACVGFIVQWGVASGLFGFLTGLMVMGCLSVIIEPFNYLRKQDVVAIYACCVLLEIML